MAEDFDIEQLKGAIAPEKEDSERQIGWNAGRDYCKNLIQYLDYMGQAQLNNDIYGWIRILNTYFSLVYPFISDSDRETLETKFDQINKDVILVIPKIKNNIVEMIKFEMRLQRTTRELIKASKNILLPTSEAGDDSFFNEESFFN